MLWKWLDGESEMGLRFMSCVCALRTCQVLASKVRSIVNDTRNNGRRVDASDGLNVSTTALINRYLV